MLIFCPHCDTSYDVEASSIGENGRSVRCARCRTVWFATATEPAVETAGAGSAFDEAWSAEPLASPAREIPAVEEAFAESAPAMADAADPDSLPPPESPNDASAGDTPAEPHAVVEAFDPAETQASDAVEIDHAPSIVPPITDQFASLPVSLPEPEREGEHFESFAARRARLRARRKETRWSVAILPAIALVLTTIIAILILGRQAVVRFAPQTASLYASIGMPVNLRGLVFDDLKTTREMQEGVPVLVVEGTITSTATIPVDVPRLRFALRNDKGGEVYSWTAIPGRPVLGPGEQIPFRSRLASPPADGRDVQVRFFGRYDTLAGIK